MVAADVESLQAAGRSKGMLSSADLTADRSASPAGSGAAVAAAADFAAELEGVISKLREECAHRQAAVASVIRLLLTDCVVVTG